MSRSKLEAALEDARHQLANAIQKQHELSFEIYRLQNLVRTLATNIHDLDKAEAIQREMQNQLTITTAVESIVNNAPRLIAPIEVRDTLLFYGYDINRYANPLALVHQTLKRLASAGRVKEHLGRYMRNDFNEWLCG